jgi:alpha-tubulin suppressor-like RCC1 family protein
MYGAGDALAPKRVGAMSDWVAVAGGDGHTCAIRGTSAGGTMWCWGRNTSNECGQGSGAAVQLRAPAQVGTANRWTSLDLGQDDALALAADHTLWGWGDASQGNLSGGNGAASLATPTQIGSDADWQSVSTDAFESCAIKASGDLYCWGRNAEGQLGLGDTNDRYSPTQTGSGTTWSTVSVGRFHMCASSSAHTVSCAGENADGQLGVGDVDRRNLLTVTGLVPVP